MAEFSLDMLPRHIWHRLLPVCWKRTLVLDTLKILLSEQFCYVGWWNFLVAESLQHCNIAALFSLALCTCFLNFAFCSSALSAVFFISLPSLFPTTLLPKPRFARSASGLHMVYCQIKRAFWSFSLQIYFTNTTGFFSQLSLAIYFSAEGLMSETFAWLFLNINDRLPPTTDTSKANRKKTRVNISNVAF